MLGYWTVEPWFDNFMSMHCRSQRNLLAAQLVSGTLTDRRPANGRLPGLPPGVWMAARRRWAFSGGAGQRGIGSTAVVFGFVWRKCRADLAYLYPRT